VVLNDPPAGKEATLAFVSKMFVGQDAAASSSSSVSDTVFVGFCRVFAGTLCVGDELYGT
jgi:hypothetical protein